MAADDWPGHAVCPAGKCGGGVFGGLCGGLRFGGVVDGGGELPDCSLPENVPD